MTAFRIDGKSSSVENEAVVARLRDEHGVLTVRRNGPAAGDVVRVTPAIYTTRADLDCLVSGLQALTGA
jgi:selenocysteine lyase/cysteine desulfurase